MKVLVGEWAMLAVHEVKSISWMDLAGAGVHPHVVGMGMHTSHKPPGGAQGGQKHSSLSGRFLAVLRCNG